MNQWFIDDRPKKTRHTMNIATSLLVSFVAGVLCGGGGHHHDDGHEENCVDISRYGEVEYNVTTSSVCTYRKTKVCNKKTASACVAVPVTECEVTGYAACAKVPFTRTFPDTTTTLKSFLPKKCAQSGYQTLIEYHTKPVCHEVTKQQCDTKWVIDAAGEKVWAGNENCADVTLEDCRLEEVANPVSVPIYKCEDDTPIYYSQPAFSEVEVTGYRSECTASAFPTCTTSTVQRCTEVEYDECVDVIKPVCFGNGAGDGADVDAVAFRIPFQKYHHTLKCIGEF